jgi:A/G-specific adenine glycosylase
MELGATVCTPRNPNCATCPVRRNCIAHHRGLTASIPRPAKRPRIVELHQAVLILERQGCVWAVRRAAGAHNTGLWEFPLLEEILGKSRVPGAPAPKPDGVLDSAGHLGTFKHTITHHRITARVYLRRNGLDGLRLPEPGRWLTGAGLRRAPMSALHRRIADAVLG